MPLHITDYAFYLFTSEMSQFSPLMSPCLHIISPCHLHMSPHISMCSTSPIFTLPYICLCPFPYLLYPLPLSSHPSLSLYALYFLFFGGQRSLLWGHWYPCFKLLVMSLGFKVSLFHAWWRCMCYTFTAIHLWCDTCQPLGSHHGSWAILFYVPVSRHWWGLKPVSIMLLLPQSVRPGYAGLYFMSSAYISQCPFPVSPCSKEHHPNLLKNSLPCIKELTWIDTTQWYNFQAQKVQAIPPLICPYENIFLFSFRMCHIAID